MGHSLSAAVLAALVGIAPGASGTPVPEHAVAPADSPLKEIGRVHATTAFCKEALGHAQTGIGIVLQNDRTLAEVEAGLRSVDLDKSVVAKNNGAHALNERYVALRASSVAGDAELKALRKQAQNAPTLEQKKALVSLANALDGALVRQRKLADAIGRLVVYIDNHAPIDKEEHDRLEFDAIASQNSMNAPHPAQGPLSGVPDQLSTIAKQGATELEQRAEPIATDENDAAARIEAAFNGC